VLAKEAPWDPKTITFQWLLALMRGELDRAQSFVMAAKKSTMSPEAIQGMEKAMRIEVSWPRRLRRHWFLWTLSAGLVGAGLLLVARSSISRNRQRVASS
jgi:hypothetical protein